MSARPEVDVEQDDFLEVSRSMAWRRRKLEAREAVRSRWAKLRTLSLPVATIVAVLGGVITGIVLYEAWLTSLSLSIFLGLIVWIWVFLGVRLHTHYETVSGEVRTWSEPRRKWLFPLAGLVLAVGAGLLPFVTTWFPSLPPWVELATNGAVLFKVAYFCLFALGLNIVVGFAGLLDLGYVAFWAIGAYTAGIMTGAAKFSLGLNASPPTVTFLDKPQWEVWMWLIIPAALVIAVIAGVLLGSPTLRLRGDYLAIVTLGFGEIVRITANNLDSITVGPRGISSIPHPVIQVTNPDIVWGTLTDDKYYWLALTFVVIWVVAIRMLDNSRIGRAWVAVREDEVAAAAMGVPVVRMKLTAFAIGACTGAVGGVLYAFQINSIAPNQFTLIQSILILAMVVIGGMGSIGGAIIGAIIVTLVPEIFRGVTPYRYLIFGAALILMMIFRPQGLLPSKRRKAELRKDAPHSEGSELYDLSEE